MQYRKGQLLFHMTGAAFSFYNRKPASQRLVLKEKFAGMTREQTFAYYQDVNLQRCLR